MAAATATYPAESPQWSQPSAATTDTTTPDPAKMADIKGSIHENLHHEDRLPEQSVLDQAADLPVLDEKGESRTFSSLYKTEGEPDSKHLIIFVRHFFCGLCQDYVRNLTRDLAPSTVPKTTHITLIGCGHPNLIADYAAKTSCPYPIYADPTRKLYEVLGMTKTLNMGETQPSYQSVSTAAMILSGMGQVLSSGTKSLKGGNISQVGGEFLFVGDQVAWCHRMRHTRDHTEVAKLKVVLDEQGGAQ